LKITIEGDVEVLIFSTKYDLFLLTEGFLRSLNKNSNERKKKGVMP
jgi:hypothetical protein